MKDTKEESPSSYKEGETAEDILLRKFGVKKKTELMTEHYIGISTITTFLEAMQEYTSIQTHLLKEKLSNEEDLNTELMVKLKSLKMDYQTLYNNYADHDRKVGFYRQETSKLREYLEVNKIGKPSQKLFDALYDHITDLEKQLEEYRNSNQGGAKLAYEFSVWCWGKVMPTEVSEIEKFFLRFLNERKPL